MISIHDDDDDDDDDEDDHDDDDDHADDDDDADDAADDDDDDDDIVPLLSPFPFLSKRVLFFPGLLWPDSQQLLVLLWELAPTGSPKNVWMFLYTPKMDGFLGWNNPYKRWVYDGFMMV